MDNMISIILPYNKDRGFLHEAIASVELQTFKDYELVLYQGDGSVSQNFNAAIDKSRGEFLKFLAEDDQLTPDSLEILISHIANYDFIYGDAENFGELDGWPVRSYDKTVTLEGMLEKNGINGGGCLYRTDILRAVGGMDESLWCGEEYDLHLKLLKAGYRHKHIDHIVYRYRRHSGNKSGRDREARHELINQIKQRYV